MTTMHDAGIARPDSTTSRPGSLTAFIDRWIYVMMAVAILAIVLIGFVPNSIRMLESIKAGTGLPIPPILHVHAVLMGAWVLLLLTQATLMATGRRSFHMQLGTIAALLAPAIVIAGFILVPVRHGQLYAAIAAAPPDVATHLQTQILPFVNNIMLAQIRVGVLFPILVATALYFRTKDSETHKRLLVLATITPLPAATDRMTFLPTTLPESPLTLDVYPFLVASPLFLWDLYRRGHIQKAYVIWLALMIPSAVVMNLLWSSPWWQETAPQLVGAR